MSLPRRENRPCSSLICPLDGFVDSPPAEDVVVGARVGGAAGVFPIPNPGTDIPAAPRRLTAPWFRRLLGWLLPVETGLCVWAGDALPLRGGRRGGSDGGPPLGFTREYGGGAAFLSGLPLRAGGGGRWDVDSPVVLRRYGFGSTAGPSNCCCWTPDVCPAGGCVTEPAF